MAELALPDVAGSAPAEDDSGGMADAPLRDGYRIVFETANEPLIAKRPRTCAFAWRGPTVRRPRTRSFTWALDMPW